MMFLWFNVCCYVFPTMQTISRRSVQPVMDIPTRALMCRFLSDSWSMVIYRAQECFGRSKAPPILSLHPPSPHCSCLAGHSILTTHRTHKYLNTQSIQRPRRHPSTLSLHISLIIPSKQLKRHLDNQKVRIKFLVPHISAKLTLRLVNVYYEWQKDESLFLLNDPYILCT